MMTEWGVVLVLITLAGGLVSIVKPIISLSSAITKLNASVEKLGVDLDETVQKNIEAHRRLWARNDSQDEKISGLDKRVAVLEDRQ